MDKHEVLDGYRADFFQIEKREENRFGIASTETPVLMPDYSRKGAPLIPEVLLMSGADLPADRTVSLLDTHERGSINAIKGSFINLRTENGQLVGDVRVSSAEPAIKTKVDEGDIKSLSVGYRIASKRYIPEGKTETIEGRSFIGPMNIVDRWRVAEVSLVAIPADKLARIRSEHFSTSGSINTDEPLKETKRMSETPATETPNTVEERKETNTTPVANDNEVIEREVAKQLAERAAKRSDFEKSARAEDDRLGLKERADELLICETMTEVYRKAVDMLSDRQKPLNPIYFGASHKEKASAAIEVGLASRCMAKDTFNHCYKGEAVAPGWEEFRGKRLLDLAKQTLELEGVDTRRMSDSDVAIASLSGRTSTGFAYNTTGTFSNLMLNVVNKQLLTGYELARVTYNVVGKIGPSVKDFKSLYRMRLAETPYLSVWTDDSLPNEIKGKDKSENSGVESYSAIYSVSYQTLINDDLSALSRIPQQLGASASQQVNYVFWKKVIDNVAVADTYSFFDNTHHANDITSGGVPSTSQLNSMRSKMMTQKGLTNSVILGADPKFLVGPAALHSTINQICGSEYDSTASQFQTLNVNKGLIPVIEPVLDTFGDTHTYYLFADTNSLTPLEVVFLEGQESPVIRNWLEPGTWSQKIQVIQSFAVIPQDWQGAVRNAGQ
jgi:phage head maturation protease